AGLEPAAPELRVAPPEPLIDLGAAGRRPRGAGNRRQHNFGLLERLEGLDLLTLLHAEDRPPREPADPGPQSAPGEPAESRGANGWQRGVIERLAEKQPGAAEVLSL